jgi:parallel beta-helix repeat protein
MKNHFSRFVSDLIFTMGATVAFGGIITKDTRWNADNGPIRLFSDIVIARGACLTIAPGTRIIVGRLHTLDTITEQYDEIDRKTIAIKVQGTLVAAGKTGKRIIFSPDSTGASAPFWYGIILDQADDQFTEISHADITGAYCAITVDGCAPVIRKNIIEYNHIGINCLNSSAPRISNCTIIFNTSAGIRITASNPVILNTIVSFNRNNGIWCDGSAKISCNFNCISENGDGNFMECDPELGLKNKVNKQNDSIDIFNNLFLDPVFSGSVAEARQKELDIALPTEKRLVKDSIIAAIVNLGRKPPQKSVPAATGRYQLSKYSPCIDAGDPAAEFKDPDGSRNDIGDLGGPEFTAKK